MADVILTPCNVACGSEIVTVNSPSGSTLECDTWLWDDMPLNSPKRPPYWNSTSGFRFDHITAVGMSFRTHLRNFIQIGPPQKKWEKRVFAFWRQDPRWQISAILDFRGPIIGSLKSPCTTSYRSSSRDHSSKSPSFGENRVFVFWRQTDRQTDGQHRCTKPLSLSRATA